MFVLPIPLEVTAVELSGGNLTIVAIVGVVALLALVMAMFFRREVLAANDGTPNMQAIARGVQEGASAYLTRQFRTLSVFAVAAFFLLFLLPAHSTADFSSATLRISRSIAFLVGAVFSALIGYLGMWLAVRANVRVASPRRDGGRDPAMQHRVPHRRARRHGHRRPRPARRLDRRARLRRATHRRSWRASASAPPCSPCSCVSAAASSPRPPTSVPTWSARSSRASPRTTRATPRRSPTTSATTSATAPAWPPTCSSPTR